MNALGFRGIRAGAVAVFSAVALATSAAAQDVPQVSVSLSASTAAPGDLVTLRILVETRGSTPELDATVPPPGLDVVSTRDFIDLQFALPGGRTRKLRREIMLRPARAGTYQIPSVTVRGGGATIRTQPLTLLVSASAPGPRSYAVRSIDGDVLLDARVAPDTVFVGQQLSVTTDILLASDARSRLRRMPEYSPPDPSGFWTQELPRTAGPSRAIAGRIYEIQTFGRAYFPISPGSYVIPPARVSFESRPSFLSSPEAHELETSAFPVVVLPIPEEGRPAGYSGAVGRFEVQLTVQPAAVAVGEPATVTLELRGQGNMKALPPPNWTAPPGLQVYPPTEEADVDPTGPLVHGTKRFTWIVIPDRPGDFELPFGSYPYFDPESREFRVAAAPAQRLPVRPGGEAAAPPAAIRPLRAPPPMWRSLAWIRAPAFAAAQVIPLLALLSALWYRERKRAAPGTGGVRQLQARRRALLDELRRAETGDPAAYFRLADAGLRGWLATRLAVPELISAETEEATAALASAGVEPRLAGAVGSVLAGLRAARYAPGPAALEVRAAMTARIDRLTDAIHQGFRMAPRAGPGHLRVATAAAVIAGSVLLAAALLGGNLRGLTGPREDASGPGERSWAAERFRQAETELAAADPGAAVRTLWPVVQRRNGDATAWFNLGTACAAAGDRGCAIWAWSRALQLQPLHRDARHNLNASGAAEELLAALTPAIPLSAEAVLLLLSLGWFVTAAWATGRVLGRGPRSRLTPAACLAGAALLSASWARAELRHPVAIVLERESKLLAAPTHRAESLRQLTPGDAVRLSEIRDERWALAATPDGIEGWVEWPRLGRTTGQVPAGAVPRAAR